MGKKNREETRMEYKTLFPDELHPGDYAVDQLHGIGLFHGLTRRKTPIAEGLEPVEREYLVLEYEDGDKVYVPVEQADRVHRYIGGSGGPPQLSHLKGHGWEAAVAKARENVQGVAAELAQWYVEREAAQGHAYGEDTPEQKQMEAAFPYTETPDQLHAIAEIKGDLQKPRPMDRLLVGDVGYGKTEVAARAAFKVVQEGRQVALLCPTSVLAAQHHATFAERLASFNVEIALLSRFQSTAEQHAVLEGLKNGSVSIVIGTHRLLSDDVTFQNLGLVIVDEEQRFGVAHKEKLKQLRNNVDVLTMTATPIPRTLQMALAGLRDVSLMRNPPEGRLPIETIVSEYDKDKIREAIARERERGGQAYFLHNRVETLEDIAAHLAQEVPEISFRIAHGQMDETTLEEAMHEFYARQADVLVCTTIIEAGVDVPNANTLVVDNAHHLGIAQLYQLRGRVGRSDKQAYALLLYREAEALTDIARQRLAALQEFSEPGSGEKIAMRDLELRGAGNLLGMEQSGPASEVGLDLYLRMLESAIHRNRGEKPNPQYTLLPAFDLPVSSGVPDTYVASERERLRLYHRMAAVRQEEEVDRLRTDMEAHHGPIPPTVEEALTVLRLRVRCRAAGIKEVRSESAGVTLLLRKGLHVPEKAASELHETLGRQISARAADRITLNVLPTKALPAISKVVEILSHAFAKRRAELAEHH